MEDKIIEEQEEQPEFTISPFKCHCLSSKLMVLGDSCHGILLLCSDCNTMSVLDLVSKNLKSPREVDDEGKTRLSYLG